MSKYLVVSGRKMYNRVADCCSFEFEDAVVESLGADLYCFDGNPPTKNLSQKHYSVVFVIVNNFRQLADVQRYIENANLKADIRCAYIFGSYLIDVEGHDNLLSRILSRNYKAISKMDFIFGGIEENIIPIAEIFNDVSLRYAPMAVDVMKINAGKQKRTIDVSGFGRQEVHISNCLADTFNQPGSERFYYHTNWLAASGLSDRQRYRDMFWHILRRSKLSLSFDTLYWNPGNRSPNSYVNPRWYESLGAGTVVVGQRPTCDNVDELLDWEDSTINLPEEPEQAVEAIIKLLDEPDKIEEISKRNLVNMHRKHDWRYRIKSMFSAMSLPIPDRLNDQISELQKRADSF